MSEEPDILLGQMSAQGHLEATVESDGKTVYLYLSSRPDSDFGMRAVWVRNLVAATPGNAPKFDQQGTAPVNPRAFCSNPFPGRAPERDALELVWLPEENGVALYEAGQLLAIVPPWSGEGGCAGYAKDAKGNGPCAFELTEGNALHARFAAARAYWAAWSDDQPGTWKQIQDTQLATYSTAAGEHSNYYAIDNGGWPPKAIIRTRLAQGVMVATLGVSCRPQPNVERSHDDYDAHSQIELGAVLPTSWPSEKIEAFLRYLSGQAAAPWEHLVWFGVGHTIRCEQWRSEEFTAALLVKDHPAVPGLSHEPQFGRPVTMLWMIPITELELQVAKDRGSDTLLAQLPSERWRHA